jgi:hypothetical protein
MVVDKLKAAREMLCKCLSVKGKYVSSPKAAYKFLSALNPHN